MTISSTVNETTITVNGTGSYTVTVSGTDSVRRPVDTLRNNTVIVLLNGKSNNSSIH